jgi:hypothetical protein
MFQILLKNIFWSVWGRLIINVAATFTGIMVAMKVPYVRKTEPGTRGKNPTAKI